MEQQNNKERLTIPEPVRIKTDKHILESCSVHSFIDQKLNITQDGKDRIASSKIYKDYVDYTKKYNKDKEIFGNKEFHKLFKQYGKKYGFYMHENTTLDGKGADVYKGIQYKPDDGEDNK